MKKLVIIVIIAFLISSCAKIKIYDKQVCGDLGEYGAHCNNTLVSNPIDIDKESWDIKRVGWMCVDSTAFNDTETALDQLCNVTKKCTYKQRQMIEEVKARIREIGLFAEEARSKSK